MSKHNEIEARLVISLITSVLTECNESILKLFTLLSRFEDIQSRLSRLDMNVNNFGMLLYFWCVKPYSYEHLFTDGTHLLIDQGREDIHTYMLSFIRNGFFRPRLKCCLAKSLKLAECGKYKSLKYKSMRLRALRALHLTAILRAYQGKKASHAYNTTTTTTPET